MTHIRVKGFKIYQDNRGKLRCYHRASGIAIDLKAAPLGSAEFLAECSRIVAMGANVQKAKPGTLGKLVEHYKASPSWAALKPKTREFYERAFQYLRPINDTPLLKFDRPLVIRIRDKSLESKGWYFANQVKTALSVLFSWAVERGHMGSNPASEIRRLPRPKSMARKNRPWTDAERYTVLQEASPYAAPVIALMMYGGMDPVDAVSLPKAAYDGIGFGYERAKTGVGIRKRAPLALKAILDAAPKHDAPTLCANSRGEPWTKSGFDSVWAKLRDKLLKQGKIGPGLTLKGLRHTKGTILREMGMDERTIAEVLAQESDSMGLHYSDRADLTRKMDSVTDAFDAEEARRRLDNRPVSD